MERIKLYIEENPHNLTKEQLCKIEMELENPKKGTISDECLDFKLWCRGLESRQESFARHISEHIPLSGGSRKRLLEVGGGRNGRLSRLLSDMGYSMTCMDPVLESESCGNIRCIRAAFDYRTTPLDGYDWVVAQEPCDATEHIIRACIRREVPFIIALCGTPHRLISGEMPKDVWSWYDSLLNIAPECMDLKIVKLYHLASVALITSDIQSAERIGNLPMK